MEKINLTNEIKVKCLKRKEKLFKNQNEINKKFNDQINNLAFKFSQML